VAQTNSDRSLVELFTTVVNEVTGLFQTEIRLLRSEVNEKVSRLTGNAGLIGVGAVALLAALFLLLQAIVKWLAVAGVPEEWGYLIVGLLVAAIGAAFLTTGINRIKQTSLVPDRAIRQARDDFTTVREHVT
jgi:hypothetical protein